MSARYIEGIKNERKKNNALSKRRLVPFVFTCTVALVALTYDGTTYSNTATVTIIITSVNDPPNKPEKPSGPASGKIGVLYTYTAKTFDVDGNQIWYWFDWGDSTNSGWIGPYAPNATASAKHKWVAKANDHIKIKAKDLNGSESNWSDPLSITMALIQSVEEIPDTNLDSRTVFLQGAASTIRFRQSIGLNR